MRASEKKWPRRSCSSPGPGPQRERKGKTTVDKDTISPAGDPFYAEAQRDDHPHGCIDGWVYLGFEGEDLDGEPALEIERVPCRRCNAETR